MIHFLFRSSQRLSSKRSGQPANASLSYIEVKLHIRTKLSYPRSPSRFLARVAPSISTGSLALVILLALCVGPIILRAFTKSIKPNSAAATSKKAKLASMGEGVTVHAAGRGNPTTSLSDGHELVTSYSGPEELRIALEQNQAEPLSLASADFDEDGVPDLVGGYAYNGKGIVTLLHGNVDSIYPNAPEAKQRQAAATFTDAPFLSPAYVFAAPLAADFIGTGDFDGDSHWDVVVASRTTKALYLLSGDGRGGFDSPREIALPGVVTAMTTGEINRADGLTDLVIGVAGERCSQILVFEGPEGALRADPEIFALKVAATSLALGQLDSEYTMDLAIAAGNELLVVQGRDRKLSLDESLRAKVPPAVTSSRIFDEQIRSVAIGHFSAGDAQSIAVLGNDGRVQLFSQSKAVRRTFAAGRSISAWKSNVFASGAWSQAQLVGAHVSSSPQDDLLVVDAADRQLNILNSAAESTLSNAVSVPSHLAASLDVVSAPVAVLPMRLNGDALSDLMVLSSGKSTPVVVPTQTASTFVVTNTNPSGPGSLQFAILDANETPGADLITFNIPGPGPFIINVTAALPAITDPVILDATTQPGFAGTPIIQLNGSQAGKGPNGFVLSAGNSVVRGMAISGFDFNGNQYDPATQDGGGAGISVRSNNDLIEGNGFGIVPFMYAGVRAVGPAVNNTIGGTTSAARNVMASVFLAVLLPQGADNNKVQGNLIGGGRVGIAYQINGPGGTANTIGGTVAGARNVIAKGSEVVISGNGNLVQGNYIGTDESGNAANNPNGGAGDGVRFDFVFGNTVGGTTAAARNVISANGGAGVRAASGSCISCNNDLNLVQGNFIGTKADGTGDLGNMQQGVVVQGMNLFNIAVGGTATGAGNIIANSKQSGVEIMGTGTHILQGNFIGTDVTGTIDLGNVQNGVYLNNTPNNVVGGTGTGAGNVISGSGLSGVLIEGAQAAGNAVQGNFIGTNAVGTAALGNDLNGVTTSQAPNNTIGGSVVAARNIISANARHGVSIGIDTNSGATGITVRNNYIGTDVTGNNCLGNGRDGVFVNRGSVNHTITDNLITCNGRDGVNIPNFATNDPGIQIQVVQNSIYANAALGIDLGDAGITPNDPGDADTGANFLQNFPVLTSVIFPPAPSEDRTGKPNRPEVTVNINATLNSTPNTAFTVHWYFSSDSQCTTNEQGSRPLVTGRVSGVTTDNNGNASFNFPFDFPVGTTNGIINTTATDPNGNTSEFSACLPVNSTPPPTVKLSASTYTANENVGSMSVTVQRTGDTSVVSAVDYATSDTAGASSCNVANSAVASSRCDYETTVGTLRFAAGETSKTILIPVVDDVYAEGAESFSVTLTNASGALLGSPSVATVTINDNEGTTGTNPFTQAGYFVRMQYLDFFSREPDPSGLNFWTNEITQCGSNAQCTEIKRINVSAAFYLSIEFRDTGYLVERIYRAAYGNGTGTSTLGGTHQFSVPVIRFEEFLPDTQEIGRGVVVGQTGWEQVLENNKQAFLNAFVQRARFTGAFPAGMTPAQYVDALNANAGGALSPAERNQLVTDLTGGAKTRAQVLRAVAEDADLNTAENNHAFVLMQFYGYLRRNPNDAPDADYTGYDFWLSKLNQFNGNFVNAEMVKAFIQSDEYRHRFGP
jgi:hypothetical protein